jgi:hypothetical protein
MRSSKTFFLSFLLPLVASVALVGWAGDLLFSHLVVYRTYNSDAGRIRRLIEHRGAEIPIFGASKARASFIPSLMGVAAYNYGMDASSYDVTDMLIEMELKTGGTSPIILDMSYTWFTGIGDETKFIPFADLPPVRGMLKRVGGWEPYYQVPGLRYFGCYDSYAKEWVAERMTLTRHTEQGYTYEKNSVPWARSSFDADVKERLLNPARWRPIESQRIRFESTLESAENRLFLLIVSPYHRSFYESYQGLDEVHSYLNGLGRFPNVIVMDHCQTDYPDELFRNTTHLNVDGARRFSAELGDELRKLGINAESRPPAVRMAE